MRGKLVVGNWKMNGGLAANAALLAELVAGWQAAPGRQLAVCVPYPYLAQAQAALKSSPIAWGAQDVSEHAAGAYTGEVSAGMLAEFGCRTRSSATRSAGSFSATPMPWLRPRRSPRWRRA